MCADMYIVPMKEQVIEWYIAILGLRQGLIDAVLKKVIQESIDVTVDMCMNKATVPHRLTIISASNIPAIREGTSALAVLNGVIECDIV